MLTCLFRFLSASLSFLRNSAKSGIFAQKAESAFYPHLRIPEAESAFYPHLRIPEAESAFYPHLRIPEAESAFYRHWRIPLPESASVIPFRIPYPFPRFIPTRYSGPSRYTSAV